MVALIEELSFNALPALRTIEYDGWIIRLSKGFTKRANSVNPLYPSTINLEEKIEKCREIFRDNNLPTIFKLTSGGFQHGLDKLLNSRGYASIEPTIVRGIDLKNVPQPDIKSIIIYSSLDDQWIKDYCRLSSIKLEQIDTLRFMLQNIKTDRLFVSLLDKGNVVACGLGVIEKGYIGIYDVIVDKEHREMGYGQQLMLNLLDLGRIKGARYSYLQVLAKNIPALHLYSKLGFKDLYNYWYRVKI